LLLQVAEVFTLGGDTAQSLGIVPPSHHQPDCSSRCTCGVISSICLPLIIPYVAFVKGLLMPQLRERIQSRSPPRRQIIHRHPPLTGPAP
jgi:hypothetical protein